MQKTLILGLGNDLLCDDAIGLIVARELRSKVLPNDSIDIMEACAGGAALLDYIVGYDKLILIDAIKTETGKPGTLYVLEKNDLKVSKGISPHYFGVIDVLDLGVSLDFAMPSDIKIFAIETDDPFTLGTEMTDQLKAVVPSVVEKIMEYI